VNPTLEASLAGAMVLVLFALGGYFGWRQIQTLRKLPAQESLARDDRRYILTQVWVRLTSCFLLIVFAGMLAGTYLSGQEQQARELSQQKKDDNQNLTDEQKQFGQRWLAYWLVMILILFVVVCLAFYDLFSIRRFGLRHYRKIQEDRRAMIERQVALMRTQRNGHDGSM
jgi:hypothetical protein